MNIEKHIEILNNLIYESVKHGGDAGGAYYSNTENILKAINEYLKFFHLEDSCVIKTTTEPNEDWLSFDITPFVALKQKENIYSF